MLNSETHQDWAQNSQLFQEKSPNLLQTQPPKREKNSLKSDWSCPVLSLLNNLCDQGGSNLCDTKQKHTKMEVLQQIPDYEPKQVLHFCLLWSIKNNRLTGSTVARHL